MVSFLFGLFAVGLIWAVGIAWPASQGYHSLLDMMGDRMNRSYERPYDRSVLRKDLMAAGFRMGDPVFIRIFKQDSRLEVWLARDKTFVLFRTYDICTFSGELGPKLAEGDRQSPEGFYQVAASQMNPNSRHHLSFNLAFPNAYDRAHGRTGTFLMVHGGCSSIGCYAVTDEKVDEIYAMVEAAHRRGQREVPVHIFPFEMNEVNLAAYREHRWFDYWLNLKTGHDLFEETRVPPRVGVCGKTYVFGQDVEGEGCIPITGWG